MFAFKSHYFLLSNAIFYKFFPILKFKNLTHIIHFKMSTIQMIRLQLFIIIKQFCYDEI
jgi:hypothetical protein